MSLDAETAVPDRAQFDASTRRDEGWQAVRQRFIEGRNTR